MYCPSCGSPNPNLKRFCAGCGTEIASARSAEELADRALLVEVLSGSRAGFKTELDLSEMRIGRRVTADLALEGDEGVSGAHCRVYVEGDRLRVADLGSTNGTLVNGARVSEAPLGPDDILELGRGGPRLRIRAAWQVREVGPMTEVRAPFNPVQIDAPRPKFSEVQTPAPARDLYQGPAASARIETATHAPEAAPGRFSWVTPGGPAPGLVRIAARAIPALAAVWLLYYTVSRGAGANKEVTAAVERVQTGREIAIVVEALATGFRIDGALPAPNELKTFLATHLEARGTKPPWQDFFGHDYILEPEMGPAGGERAVVGFTVRSVGPDGIPGTLDDLTKSFHPPNWEALAREGTPR